MDKTALTGYIKINGNHTILYNFEYLIIWYPSVLIVYNIQYIIYCICDFFNLPTVKCIYKDVFKMLLLLQTNKSSHVQND